MTVKFINQNEKYSIDNIRELLSNLKGNGEWSIEKSERQWALYAENVQKIENKEYVFHPFKIISVTDNNYCPNKCDEEFILNSPKIVKFLLDYIDRLEKNV